MIIPPIPPISPLSTAGFQAPSVGASPGATAAREAAQAESGAAFGSGFTGALENLDAQQKNTDSLAKAAATGDLQSIEQYMISSTETQLTTQLTVAVRDRAVEAFNDIMRMQV